MSTLDKFFLSAGARDISMGRQKALQAVRKLVAGAGEAEYVGSGGTAEAFKSGGKIVKRTNSVPGNAPPHMVERELKEFKRRGFLDSILGDLNAAPETHLVETSRNKYLVQDPLHTPHMSQIPDAGPGVTTTDRFKFADDKREAVGKAHGDAEDLRHFLAMKGVGTRDVRAHNIGYDEAGHAKLFDSGQLSYPSGYPQGTPPMSEAQRQKALEKFVSIGKRKKPWLEK